MTTPTTAVNSPLTLYLCSQSPRRKELLTQLGIRFNVLPKTPTPIGQADEVPWENEQPDDYIQRILQEKLQEGLGLLQHLPLPPGPLLVADTMVVLEQEILGKPLNPAEASTTLSRLSGKTHTVQTAIAIHWQGTTAYDHHISSVQFAELSPAEIESYCNTTEPYDKAGGYGIQGSAAAFITHISGSYSGIMGLPLYETKKLLQFLDLWKYLLRT